MSAERTCWRDVVVVLGLVAAFARAAAAAVPESDRAPAAGESSRSTAADSATATDSAEPASVLLVTIDTLRYDRTLANGPMPRLLRLAREGVSFTPGRAADALRTASTATTRTG